MILGEPGKTQYDVNFSLFGVPVRIHPFFYLISIFIGASTGDGYSMVIFGLIFFVSVLVHEMGHVVAMMNYRQRARVVLYGLGGLAIPDSGWGNSRSFTPEQQIVVSFAGPFAGFLLALVVIGGVQAAGGQILFAWDGLIPGIYFDLSESVIRNRFAAIAVNAALWCNVYLNLLNLLPVFPLDGGQIARQLFLKADPWTGVKNSLILSLIVAGILALYGFANRQTFLGFLFFFLAYSNFQSLQMMGTGGFGGGGSWRGGGGRPW